MISVDTREFDRALAKYQEATGKDFAEAANRGLKNACYRAVKHAEKADKSAIRALGHQPRLAAWILAKRDSPKGLLAQIGAEVRSQWGKGEPRKKVTKRGRFTTYSGQVRYYTAAELRQMMRALVRTRSRAVTFMRGFLLRMAKTMEGVSRGRHPGGVPAGTKDVGLRIGMEPARAARPQAGIAAAYDYRKRSQPIAARAERILQRSLEAGLREAAADMTQYAEERLAQRAAEFGR